MDSQKTIKVDYPIADKYDDLEEVSLKICYIVALLRLSKSKPIEK
jgi:hypothetical protein